MIDKKTRTTCKVEKSLEEFYKGNSKDATSYICKSCDKKKAKRRFKILVNEFDTGVRKYKKITRKKCLKCRITKGSSSFSNSKRREDGLQVYCKDCCNRYYQNNKEKWKSYQSSYRNCNK